MLLNRQRAQNYLQNFDFESQFIEELGWNTVDRVPLPFELDGEFFEVLSIAKKRGFTVFKCITTEIPARPIRVKLDRQLTNYSKSHLLVFGDEDKAQQKWLWLKPETNEVERAKLRAELDGIIAHLNQLTEIEFQHILSTFPIVPDPAKQAALTAYRDVERGLIPCRLTPRLHRRRTRATSSTTTSNTAVKGKSKKVKGESYETIRCIKFSSIPSGRITEIRS
jgi:hypothetical protein